MTFEQLKYEVRTKVSDMSTAFDDSIPDFVNDAVDEIVLELGGVPSLKTYTTLSTSLTANYVSMPSGFSGILTYVGDEDGEIERLSDLEALVRVYPKLDETGSTVEYVALEGNKLYYQPIVTPVVTMYLVYYAKPTRMVQATETPTCLPEELHRAVIVPKAAELIFKIIEEGVEGDHVNTLSAQQDYSVGLARLQAWKVRTTRKPAPVIWE